MRESERESVSVSVSVSVCECECECVWRTCNGESVRECVGGGGGV